MTEFTDTEAPSGGGPSEDERNWAVFAHVGGLAAHFFTGVLGFAPPLIIYLVKKDESEFVADQAKEALNFQITALIAYMVSGILALLCIGFILLGAVYICAIVFGIIASVKAANGERYRYPLTLRLVS